MTKGNVRKRGDAAASGYAVGGHTAGEHATGGGCDANHANQKPRSHDTSRIAWARLLARVGEGFPLECPNCGGDIRLRKDGRHVIRRAKTSHSSAPKTGHRVGGIEQKNRLIRFCWQGA